MGRMLLTATLLLAQYYVYPVPGGTVFAPQGGGTGSIYGGPPGPPTVFAPGIQVTPTPRVFHLPNPNMPCPQGFSCVWP